MELQISAPYFCGGSVACVCVCACACVHVCVCVIRGEGRGISVPVINLGATRGWTINAMLQPLYPQIIDLLPIL
jgi:hypothetical protein